MNTILVPIDFSDESINAVDYATEMALYTDSQLILLHVYDNTPPALDIPIIASIPALEIGIKYELTKIAKRIEFKHGKDIIQKVIVRLGFVVDEINQVAQENNVDMIIIGIRDSGYLTERLMGSIPTSVVRKSLCPILIVGKGMRFKKPEKMLLATDGNRISNDHTYLPLKKVLAIFKPHLYVLHIIPDMVLNDSYDDLDAFNLDEEWLNNSLSFHHMGDKSITHGIREFLHDHEIDMLVMVPHKHDFFERVLQEPQTQKMSFRSTVPLLALPELT